MIPQNIIEDLRQRIDLVSVLEQIVPLKRSGSNYMACCPFHDEKTPSFHISHAKQLFHCFGCGVGGNVYHFLMKYHHFDFPQALDYVAREVGFDLEPFKKKHDPHHQDDEKIKQSLQYAKDKFHHFLLKDSRAKFVRDYITSRGISPETIVAFGLGYVPDGWDNLVLALKKDQQPLEMAQKAGLIQARKKDPNQHYDVFRNRLMVPIMDSKGSIVGFGGRTMGDDPAKYVNSPQTHLFDKSKILYGLSMAEKAIRSQKNVFVVEGYFDQMMLFQHGIENVVATMGTAMTPYHSGVLKRYSPRITLVFDGDQAGLNACKKAAKSILPEGIDTDVVVLPQGQDPDSFIQKNGKEAFENLAKTPILDFLISYFYIEMQDLAEKTSFLKEMVEVVSNAKNPYIGKVLQDEICAKMKLDPMVFVQKPTFQKPTKPMQNSGVEPTALRQEEVMVVVMYAQNQGVWEQLSTSALLDFIMDPQIKAYTKACLEDESLKSDPTKWIDHWENPVYKAMLTHVLLTMELHMQDSNTKKVWVDCFSKLKKIQVSHLVQEIRKAENQGDTHRIADLSKKMMEMKNYQPLTL